MCECIENERDRKENRLGVHLIDELNGYLDWIFLNFFFFLYCRTFWQSGKAYGPSQNYVFKSLNKLYRNPKEISYILTESYQSTFKL